MAEVVLFHHALGLTEGCVRFAQSLRDAGHVVHLPDLYGGATFTVIDEGVAYADHTGFDTIIGRATSAVEHLPHDLVYGGFSLGVVPAQVLTQTRPGAKAAMLFHGAVPPSELGGSWPTGIPLQIHTMEGDPLGDVDVARQLAETIEDAELFLYPGDRHLFADPSWSDYDDDAACLLGQRVLTFLDGLS